MRLWRIDGGGAFYWAAANTCCEALRVALDIWKVEGVDGDDIEHVEVCEETKANVWFRDDADDSSMKDARKEAAEGHGPCTDLLLGMVGGAQ